MSPELSQQMTAPPANYQRRSHASRQVLATEDWFRQFGKLPAGTMTLSKLVKTFDLHFYKCKTLLYAYSRSFYPPIQRKGGFHAV